MTCEKGVPDYVTCTCIIFDGSENYDDIIFEFERIKNEAEGGENQNISDWISDIQKEIDDLEQYIIDNKGNLDNKYISLRLLIIKEMLNNLNYIVKEFLSTLKPNLDCPKNCTNSNFTQNPVNCGCSCSLSCKPLLGEVDNRQYCQCVQYDDWVIIYNMSSDVSALRTKLHAEGADPDFVTDLLIRVYQLADSVSSKITDIRYASLNANYTKFSEDIKALHNRYTDMISEYKEWSRKWTVTAEGDCEDSCATTRYVRTENCSCFNSAETNLYYTELNTLSNLQMRILRYTRNGPKDELKQFQERALSVRFVFEIIFDYFYNNFGNYDEIETQSLIENAKNQSKQLKIDFDAWELLHNPPSPSTPCYICAPNQIKVSCYNCVTIIDWEKLADVVEKGLPGVLTDINGLINSTNQNVLRANW